MARFSGKKVLVTGGTSGIGLATAARIAEEGGEVAVTGRSEAHLEEARAALPEGARVIRNDAADPAAAEALAEEMSGWGPLDGVYLNAGFGGSRPTEEVDAEFYDRMNAVNVRAPALQMARLKPMIADGGAVLLTSSVAPYLGGAEGAVYAATKASCLAFARSWARDLASRGIRVNAVGPGPIETNFFDAISKGGDEAEDLRQKMGTRLPLGRMGTAKEVAAVCCFLLSDDAAYVTGSEYMVDGGLTMR